MANKTIEMRTLRSIIRLYCQGTGTKAIGGMLGISRNTVRKYVLIFNSAGITLDEFCSKSDSELDLLFGTSADIKSNPRKESLYAMLPELCKKLKKGKVFREDIYRDYKQAHPDGYGLTQFNYAVYSYLKLSKSDGHVDHKAGDKLFVDYTGDKLQLTLSDGTKQDVEVFVAVLGCSQYTYVEAVMSQNKEDFISCCQNSLHFFGGVPKVIVPDNLKSAVTKSSRYEAILNDEFKAFAEHYSMVVLPARAYRPKDKALVEGAVRLIYKNIYSKLDGKVFYDLRAMNFAILSALESYNNAPFWGRTYSRREQYEDIERECMGELSRVRYEPCRTAIVTVMRNSFVRLSEDVHYYSVPYQYIGKKVKIIYSSNKVDIYYKHSIIATHSRVKQRYQYTTNADHLASNHRYILDCSPEKFIERGMEIDPDVGIYMEKVIETKPYAEQAYKACSGILSLERKVGRERLAAACRWAASLKQYEYLAVEDILNRRIDNLENHTQSEELPQHDNIRGKEYFS